MGLSLLRNVTLTLSFTLIAFAAQAGMNGTRVMVSPYAGAGVWSSDFGLRSDPLVGGRLGATVMPWMSLEGTFGYSRTMTEFEPIRVADMTHIGLDVLVSPYSLDRLSPYATLGFAQVGYRSDAIDDAFQGIHLVSTGWEFGGGLRFRLGENEKTRTAVRLDARDVINPRTQRYPDVDDDHHNLIVSAGIEISFDVLFRAPSAPLDTDGDGVADPTDACPKTPFGAHVDDTGCPIDSDQDGIADGLDLCADTMRDVPVDASGCPIIRTDMERELLNTGVIRRTIRFATGSSRIDWESFSVLDGIGRTLTHWPELRIEIGGHTDSEGSEERNQEISESRARAVFDYLLRRFPEIASERLTARGYGEAEPIDTNETPEGRSRNRRVEFTLLNPEVMKTEIERRRFQ